MTIPTVLRGALVGAILLSLAPAHAALPPQHQRMAELKAVIEAAELGGVPDAVGEIVAIEYLGPDVYEIRGETCSVMAFIRSLPPAKGPPVVGPRQFSVELQPTVCR